MTAGNAKGTKPSDVPVGSRSSWFCPDENIPLDKNGFPSRKCAAILQQILYFPECVNPSTLATVYKTDRKAPCPSGYKQIPQLRYSIRYDLRKALPNGWNGEAPIQLASGNAYSSHGDFMMGWPQDAADNLLKAVNQGGKNFMGVDGKRGTAFQTPTCKPKDADPTRGTSDYAQSVRDMNANMKRTVSGARLARSVV